MLIINNDDVAKLLTMKDCIAVQEDAFKKLPSGGMARTFLEAFTCVRDIRLCKIYSPNAARREAYAEEMSKKLNIEVRAVSTAREAVKGADILSSCTDSMIPVYDADWVEKGMHVTNLGRREIPEAATAKFDVVLPQRVPGLQIRNNVRVQADRGLPPSGDTCRPAQKMNLNP